MFDIHLVLGYMLVY